MNGYPELIALIKANPAWASLSDSDCAAAVVTVAAPAPTQMVFGSFRTLSAIITQAEYNTLRAALNAAATAETNAGGTFYADMVALLKLPGDQQGNGGGLDFTNAAFVANLAGLCSTANLPDVPGKVAAYAASLQPPPSYPWAWVGPDAINCARTAIAGGE